MRGPAIDRRFVFLCVRGLTTQPRDFPATRGTYSITRRKAAAAKVGEIEASGVQIAESGAREGPSVRRRLCSRALPKIENSTAWTPPAAASLVPSTFPKMRHRENIRLYAPAWAHAYRRKLATAATAAHRNSAVVARTTLEPVADT